MIVELLESVLAPLDALAPLDERPLIPAGAALFDVRVSSRRADSLVLSCVCARCGWRASLFFPVQRMARHVARCGKGPS